MIVGVTSVIDNKADVAAAITPTTPADYILQIIHDVASVHALIGVFIPLMLCGLLTRFFGSQRSFAQGLKAWRFAIFAGIAFTVPYVIISRLDRKSTRLNSSHVAISYAVFCLKKKK